MRETLPFFLVIVLPAVLFISGFVVEVILFMCSLPEVLRRHRHCSSLSGAFYVYDAVGGSYRYQAVKFSSDVLREYFQIYSKIFKKI